MVMAKVANRFLKGDPWNIVEETFDPSKARVTESIFSLANEFMGLRGYFDEGYSGDHLQGSYFGGLYENKEIGHPQIFKGFVTRESFIVNACDWLYTRIAVDGEQLDLAKSAFTDYVRCTNLWTGTLTRSFVWKTRSGKRIKLTFERLLSMVRNNVAIQRIVFESLDGPCTVSVRTGLNFGTYQEIAAGWDMRHEQGSARKRPEIGYWDVLRKEARDKTWAIEARTKTTQFSAACTFRLQSDVPLNTSTYEEPEAIGCDYTLSLEYNRAATVDKIVVNHWERPSVEPPEKVWKWALELAQQHAGVTYDSARTEQAEYWRKFWSTRDIVIDGDDDLQQGVRYDMMQLHMAYHGGDERLAIPSKGLTAEVYSGWIFWVVETYCQQMMIFADPAAARKLLMFRYRGLPGAIERAQQVDCKGARYPFCTIDGPESCATWQHADMEIHVGEGVFFAIQLYARHTGDTEFLYKYGVEMLLQICRFYASRGNWSPRGDFGFYGVMGPDEYKSLVNHNYYTNLMGKKCFEYTTELLAEMQKKAPAQLKAVTRKVKLDPSEPKEWRRMAGKMRLPRDTKTGLCEQHDGYFDLPEVDVKGMGPDQIPIYKHWAYERILRMNMVKQADVLLLPLWFSHEWSDRDKKVNYDFYEARTIHESTFSPSVHMMLAAELGYTKQAYEFFKYMCRVDLDDYQKNTAQGLHMTPKSGTWMCMVNGWAGLRTDLDHLTFKPSIPPQWKAYRFRLVYRGSVMEVAVDQKTAQFKIVSGEDLGIEVYDRKVKVTSTGVTVPLKSLGKESPAKKTVRDGKKRSGR